MRMNSSGFRWLVLAGVAMLAVGYAYATTRGTLLWLALTGSGIAAVALTFHDTHQRKRGWLVLLVLAAACLGGGVWLRSSPLYVIETFGWGDAPFDQALWKTVGAARAPMVRDLLRMRRLEGRAATELRELLGPPNDVWVTDRGATKRWSYTFDVSALLDNNTLAMYLGKDDRVTSVFVSSD